MYFHPVTFCRLVPPCLLVSNCTINSPDRFLLCSPPHHMAVTTVTTERCACVCVCERVLRILAELVCPQDLWVSSCVGNMTLRPQPVAADGNSTTAKRKRGARRKCCYHQLAQWLSHEQSVRRVQQQERVGVHVGCTEAPQV